MKYILPVIALFISCIIATSCQKDAPAPATPPPQDSLVRLSKLIYFDAGAGATDTSAMTVFGYDNQQRVTTITTFEYSNRTPEILDVSHYYYKGADILAFESDHEEVGTPYKSTFYYFYDNAERLIRDSAIFVNSNGTNIYLDQFIYSAAKIIATRTKAASGDVTTDTGYVGTDGNIEKVVSTDIGIGRNVTTHYIYDDHPNPFFQLNIRASGNPVPDIAFDTEDGYGLRNNVVDQTIKNLLFPGSLDNTSYKYSYNVSGLPETVKKSDDNGQSFYEMLVFVYKKI